MEDLFVYACGRRLLAGGESGGRCELGVAVHYSVGLGRVGSRLCRGGGAKAQVGRAGAAVVVIVAFGGVIGLVAMPALAGLLMLIGYRTIHPADLRAVWQTGDVQKAVALMTFVLTMLVPLQYAVLTGVGPNEVVVLQPYGSLFFASAPAFEAILPAVKEASRNSVVLLRLRGRSDLGSTFADVLVRYAQGLAAVASKLVVVSVGDEVRRQLEVGGIIDVIGADNVYGGDERVGAALRRAYDDAIAWVAANEQAVAGSS